jgi:energy-coupling factor transport system permease protein
MSQSAQAGLYVSRSSGLHALNPLTKLVLAGCLIVVDFLAPNFWLPSLLFIGVVLPLSLWGKVASPVVRLLIKTAGPIAVLPFIIQSLFYSGGKTVLVSFAFFSIKLEGVQFAYLITTRILTMAGALFVLLCTTHLTILMADLSRRKVPPFLIYIVVSTLQLIPQVQAKARTIIDAQHSRGLRTEGGVLLRMRALLPLVIPLVLGSLQETEERAIALEARGFKARRRKTSLIVVPDSSRQFIARISFILVALFCIVGAYLWR